MQFVSAHGCIALALLLIAQPAAAMDAGTLARGKHGCHGAGGLAAGDRRISPEAAGISGSARGVRRGGRRLLELDRREAAWPQRQAAGTSGDRSRRLCADAAAGLYRTEASGELAEPEPEAKPRPRKAIPVVADLLQAAREHFQWTPQRPASEVEFKRAYARVASAAGLTREQAVRVYSFETGGNGNYDMQSGLAQRPARSRPRSATTSCSPPTVSNSSPSRATNSFAN